MRKSILPASILALAAAASAQDAYNDPQTTAWREICDNNYFWNMGIQTPWDPVARLGIDLSNVLCTDLAKDWDVYNRRMSPFDVTQVKNGATGANVYFTLYNRRAGVLRTFIWLDPAQDAAGTYYSVRLDIEDGGANRTQDHSLLAYEGGGAAHTVSQRLDAAKNTDKIYFTDRHVNSRWFIEDTHVSFDMNGAHSQALYFDYLVNSHTTGNIKLNGTIGPEGQSAAGLGVMSSAIKTFKSAGEGYSAGVSGTKAASEIAKSVGGKIKDLGGNGQFLIDLGTSVAGMSSGIGAIFAGSQFISGFLGWNGGGQIGMAPSVVSLSGSLSYVHTTTNPRVPLANANFIPSQQPLFAQTYNTTGDKNLGLFVMSDAPDVKVFEVLGSSWGQSSGEGYYKPKYYISIADPTCGLYINPASGAKLKEVKIAPVIHFNYQLVPGFKTSSTIFANQPLDVRPALTSKENWNKVLIASDRRSYFQTPVEQPTVSLKISFIFDIGRGQEFEAVNTYTPRTVSYTRISGVTTTRDFGFCSQADFLRTSLEQASSDLWVRSEATGPNWYSLYGYSGATGSSVAVSGRTGDGETSTMTTSFTGSGASFRWRVSSETGYDYLAVYVDGYQQAFITGITDWATQSLSFPYGSHTLSWKYVKDGSWQLGEDRGMVDNLVLR